MNIIDLLVKKVTFQDLKTSLEKGKLFLRKKFFDLGLLKGQELNALEKVALEKALESSIPWIKSLRRQIPHLKVISREYNSAGGYTEVSSDSQAKAVFIPSDSSEFLPGTSIQHPKMPDGGGFIVWPDEKGRICSLEFFGYTDWPYKETSFENFTIGKFDRPFLAITPNEKRVLTEILSLTEEKEKYLTQLEHLSLRQKDLTLFELRVGDAPEAERHHGISVQGMYIDDDGESVYIWPFCDEKGRLSELEIWKPAATPIRTPYTQAEIKAETIRSVSEEDVFIQKIEKIVRGCYRESRDDYIGLWEILGAIDHELKITEPFVVRKVALDIVKRMLALDMRAVDLSQGGSYIAWPNQNPEYILRRIDDEWQKLGKRPSIADIAWFTGPEDNGLENFSKRQITYADIVAILMEQSPELELLYNEHIQDNKEVLPYVLFDQIMATVIIPGFLAPEDSKERKTAEIILQFMEEAMQSEDEGVKNLIVISFLEYLDTTAGKAYSGIKAALGPLLRAQLERMENWPEAEITKMFLEQGKSQGLFGHWEILKVLQENFGILDQKKKKRTFHRNSQKTCCYGNGHR